MRMEAGLDTGPVYHRVSTPIDPHETGGSLHDRLATLGAQALLEALPGIADGSRSPSRRTIAKRPMPTSSARMRRGSTGAAGGAIERQVRAFDPWPVAQTISMGASLRIWSAEAEDDATVQCRPEPSSAADKTGIPSPPERVLRLTRLQPAGKKPMSAADYLNARHLEGARFGC
jgi:methionyl-tRNA formyltransferase